MTPNIPTSTNNPGDLRFAGQSGAQPSSTGFAQFSSPQQGYAALLNQIQTDINNHPDWTLEDFATNYAPPSQNNTGQYTANLANKIGVAPNTKIGTLQSKIGDFADAIAGNEGFQANTPGSSGGNIPVTPLGGSAQPQPQGGIPITPLNTSNVAQQSQPTTQQQFNQSLPLGTKILQGQPVGAQQGVDTGIGIAKGIGSTLLGASGDTTNPVIKGMLANAPALQSGVNTLQQAVAPSNPTQAAASGQTQFTAQLIPGGEADEAAGASSAIKGALSTALKGDTDPVVDAVMPRLTPKVAAEAPTETKGLLGKISVTASKYQKAVADAVRPYFNPKATWSANAQTVDKAISDLADQTETHIAQNNVLRPIKEVAAKIRNVEEPISLKGTPFEKQITPLKNAFVKIMRGNGGDLSGEFQSLRDFDNYVDKTYPTLWDRENAPMRNAVVALRNTVKDDIASHLPKDSPYRDLLDQQSKLFDARDTFREKAALGVPTQQGEIGTTALGRWAASHPGLVKTTKGALKTGLGIAVGGELLNQTGLLQRTGL